MMAFKTPPDHLQEICRSFFGVDVAIAPRAASALLDSRYARQVLFRPVAIAIQSETEVFRHVIGNSPACADALLRNEVPLYNLQQSPPLGAHVKVAELKGDASQFLSAFFHDPLSPKRMNSAGELVASTRLLTEVDLFAGALEAGRGALFASKVVKALLRPLDLVAANIVAPAGDALLDRMVKEIRQLGSVDPSHAQQQFILFLDEDGNFRIRPFGATALGRLAESRLPEGPFIFRGGSLQPLEARSEFDLGVIAEFESLVNSAKTSERDYQVFFERNPYFLSGLEYGRIHPHPILYKDDGRALIPDFFLEKMDGGWEGILDLKRSDKPLVIRKLNRTYFAQWVQEAISQLKFYREWFDGSKNRRAIERQLGLPRAVFRPKIVLVAGRKHHFQSEVERVRLMEDQGHDFTLWTYDDLLGRAKIYNDFILSQGPLGERTPNTTPAADGWRRR